MDAICRIEGWFDGEHEDCDFIRVRRDDPYLVYGPVESCDRVFYCTKTSVAVSAIDESPSSLKPGLIARFGLPRDEDVSWLKNLIGSRQLIFVGDLDPVDVMIFAWNAPPPSISQNNPPRNQ